MKRIVNNGLIYRLGVRVRDYGQVHKIIWLMRLGHRIKDWGVNNEWV